MRSGREQVSDSLGGQGFGEEVALGQVAAHPPEPLELFLCLHALGYDFETQSVHQTDHGRHQHPRPGVFAEPADEGAVDLDEIYGEPPEVGERGVPRAEVVQDRTHAEVLKFLEGDCGRKDVPHRSALCDLQEEAARLQSSLMEYTLDALG